MRRPRNVRGPARGIGHCHPERRRFLRHGSANPAEADEAKLLATQLHPEHVIERPAAPGAGTNDAFAFAEPPGHGENQAPREIRARIGQHIRRIGDGDVAGTAGRDVDVVVANGDVGDDFQLWAGSIEHRGVDRVGEEADNRVHTLDTLQQFIARDGRAPDVQIDVTGRFQFRNDG